MSWRESFDKYQGQVDSAKEESVQDADKKKELKEELLKVAGEGNLERVEELVREIKGVEGKGSDSRLEEAEKDFEKFYGRMHEHALEEDRLRDALKEASALGDYDKVIEVAESLKSLDKMPADPEGLDLEATQEILKEFAPNFKWIGGLVEGKAVVILPNGKCAFIDHDGKIVSEEYREADSYSEGKASVKLPNGKWAYIDHDGKVIPFME